MNKIIFSLIVVLSALFTQAQPPQNGKPPTMEEKMKRTNEVIKKAVSPTADQQKTIDAAYKEFFTAADKLMVQGPPSEKNRKQIEVLEKARDKKIQTALTPAQYKKYEAVLKDLQPPKPGGGNAGGTPPIRN